MRDISETVIYWLFIDWKSAVAFKTPICPHVLYDPPPTVLFWQSHGSHNDQAWWRGIHLICTFSTASFSWFISYSASTEGRTSFICEEIVFCIMLLERPDSLCTWPSMSVTVSTIHCQFFVKVNHYSFFETLTNCSWKLWKIVLFSKQNCYMNLCLKTNKLHL